MTFQHKPYVIQLRINIFVKSLESFTCINCESIVSPKDTYVVCPNCGQAYELSMTQLPTFQIGWGTIFLVGLAIGGLIVGPLIWTAVGRHLAVQAIKKGARVTEEKVKSWIEAGTQKKLPGTQTTLT